MAGLKIVRTKVEGRKAEPIAGSEQELRAPLVISSIGSVPEVLPGVTMKGEYYTFDGEDIPRYLGCERVFGVGNVVTGQGNIRVSLVHSQRVTGHLLENYLDVGDSDGNLAPIFEAMEKKAAAETDALVKQIEKLPALSAEQIRAIDMRIGERQKEIGYEDYDSWIASVTPADLE